MTTAAHAQINRQLKGSSANDHVGPQPDFLNSVKANIENRYIKFAVTLLAYSFLYEGTSLDVDKYLDGNIVDIFWNGVGKQQPPRKSTSNKTLLNFDKTKEGKKAKEATAEMQPSTSSARRKYLETHNTDSVGKQQPPQKSTYDLTHNFLHFKAKKEAATEMQPSASFTIKERVQVLNRK